MSEESEHEVVVCPTAKPLSAADTVFVSSGERRKRPKPLSAAAVALMGKR
jgi:hypothetical protein